MLDLHALSPLQLRPMSFIVTPAVVDLCSKLHVPFLAKDANLALAAFGCSFFFAAQAASHAISPKLFPKSFATFSKKTKLDWDLHFVSRCSTICCRGGLQLIGHPTRGVADRLAACAHLNTTSILLHPASLTSTSSRSHLQLRVERSSRVRLLRRLLPLRSACLAVGGQVSRCSLRCPRCLMLLHLLQGRPPWAATAGRRADLPTTIGLHTDSDGSRAHISRCESHWCFDRGATLILDVIRSGKPRPCPFGAHQPQLTYTDITLSHTASFTLTGGSTRST